MSRPTGGGSSGSGYGARATSAMLAFRGAASFYTDMPIHETQLAEGVGFEPTRERNPLPVFKTGALNHSATLPDQ